MRWQEEKKSRYDDWLDFTTFGDKHEVQYHPFANVYRHREYYPSPDKARVVAGPWMPGLPASSKREESNGNPQGRDP